VDLSDGRSTLGSDLDASTSPRRRLSFPGVLIAITLSAFAAFWVWALFFASKEAINNI
jgi:hypothetical protein